MVSSSSNQFLFGLRGRALRMAMMVCIVAPGFTLYGYNQSGLGPIANLPSFVKSFPEVDTMHTHGAHKATDSTKKGAVIATYQLGALAGALSCVVLGDILGRRRTLMLGAFLVTIGQVIQTSSYSLAQFIVGRAVLGFGTGELSVVIPVWLTECSTATHRGRDVVLAGTFLCFGYAICNWVDFGFSQLPTSTLQWRLPLAVSIPFSVFILATISFLPESPRWLIRNNQRERAIETLAALRDRSLTDVSIATEIAQIESSLELAAQKNVSLFRLLRKNDQEKLLYRFCLCFFIQFFQQMCGGSLISVYASTIFQQNLGLNSQLSKVLASCALTWKWICCFIGFLAIDRWGRRVVFIVSGIGMSLCMVALAVSTSFGVKNHSASIASAFFIFVFNIFFPIGFLGPNFLYASEVAPVRLRVAMNSISTGNHWLWNFVITMITPVALETIGYRYYIIFAVISACIPIVVYAFYPETMNTDLETLNNVFRNASSPWQIVSEARKLQHTRRSESLYSEDEKAGLEDAMMVEEL